MNEAWLIRHAQTAWADAGRHTGRTDVLLTAEGRATAVALGDELDPARFTTVLVSPLSRARETADLAGLGAAAQPRDDLLEFDYGAYEGLTTPEIRKQRPDWTVWADGCPDGETADDVGVRVDRVIAEVLGIDGDVALVAHGHVLRVLAARWLQQPAAFGARLAMPTGAVGRLGFERDTRVLTGWNR